MYVVWCHTLVSWFVSLKYNFEGLLLHRIEESIIWDISCRPWISVCQPVESHHQDLFQRKGKKRRAEVDHVLQLSLSDVMGRGAPIWAATTTSGPALCRPRKSPQRYFPLSLTQPTPATTALSIYVVSQNQHTIFSSGWILWSDFKYRVLHPIWMYGSESS